MKMRIGKATDNDYVLDDPTVSRHHAILSRNEADELFLEDANSTNGTYVNDSQIVRKKVKIDSRVSFGLSAPVSIADILHSNNDYIYEFARLKGVYDTYVKEKIRIQSSNQFKTRLFQSLPFALVGVAGVVFGFMGHTSNHKTLLVISLLVAVCAPTIGIYFGARQAAKIPALLQSLANQFKIDYVCPKCGAFLGEIPWESLRNKKVCPTPGCKAVWVEADRRC